ncbi:MAG: class I SAM-dependent methyltransferase [Planctomycetia bacterium]|nr:class I SAM-dependent methyltransferase [Planctomycetia bacterium]
MIAHTQKMPGSKWLRDTRGGESSGTYRGRDLETEPTVVDCYEVIDQILPECGILDLTEGMYFGDPSTPYDVAQQNQVNWLLDQVQCEQGSRLLEIGCGNGSLLETAQGRGAQAVGITVSPQQVERCRQRGLSVHLLDYRDIDESWDATFDCIVANGSMEHFVQPSDAASGQQDAIYREFFKSCHRILDPRSSSGRIAATVIHFDHFRPDPDELMRNPIRYVPLSARFHMALLERVMGGYYPSGDQLSRCAAPCFELLEAVNGTEDYRLTSEDWLRRIRRGFLSRKIAPRMLRRLVPRLRKRPLHTVMALSLLFTASWQWQFRGHHPPTRLLRSVWQRKPAGRLWSD